MTRPIRPTRWFNLRSRNLTDLLGTLLIVAVVGIASLQLYLHKTTVLTPWKGGGFGMYTTSHANFRTVWVKIKYEHADYYLRLWPQDERFPRFAGTAKKQSKESLEALIQHAFTFRFFPREAPAEKLLDHIDDSAELMSVLLSAVADVTPPKSPIEQSILVFQTEYQFEKKVIRNRELFEYSRTLTH